MASRTHNAAENRSLCFYRVSLPRDAEAIDAGCSEVAETLHAPYLRHPNRLPVGTHYDTWRQWFATSLPLTLGRLAQLLLIGARIPSFGQAWAVRVLQPLADLVGCDVVPRGRDAHIGSLAEELAEASVAVSEAFIATDRGDCQAKAAAIEKAKRELDDLKEVS